LIHPSIRDSWPNARETGTSWKVVEKLQQLEVDNDDFFRKKITKTPGSEDRNKGSEPGSWRYCQLAPDGSHSTIEYVTATTEGRNRDTEASDDKKSHPRANLKTTSKDGRRSSKQQGSPYWLPDGCPSTVDNATQTQTTATVTRNRQRGAESGTGQSFVQSWFCLGLCRH